MPLTNKETEVNSNNSISQLYKHRKTLLCISDGISMFTNNFTKYTISTLIPTVIVAILASIYSFLLLKYTANETFAFPNILQLNFTWIALVLITVFLVLYTCISYVFIEYSCIKKYTIHFQQMFMISLRRFHRVFLLYFINICTWVIMAICLYYIFSKELSEINSHDILNISVCSIASLLVLISSLPYKIVLPTLMFEKVGLIKGFINGYKLGLRIWIKNFKLFILLLFIKLIIGVILLAPVFVYLALFNSYFEALINGDNVYLSKSFIISYVVITFLIMFVLIYFITALNLSYIYLYSSAITDKIEKENNYIPIA